MPYLTTLQVSRLLGISVSRLNRCLWLGELAVPKIGNRYLFSREDVLKTGWRLLGRDVTYILDRAETQAAAEGRQQSQVAPPRPEQNRAKEEGDYYGTQ